MVHSQVHQRVCIFACCGSARTFVAARSKERRVPLCPCVSACLCMWLCACVYQCECAAGSVAVRRATLCLCRYLCVEGIDVRRATLCLRRCESACVCVSV